MGKKRVYKEYRDTRMESLFGIIAVFILIFFVIGFFSVWRDVKFLIADSASTNGKVISCQIERDPKGRTYCEATISFDTQSGQYITFKAPAGNSNEGDMIAVLYHPNHPEDARIDTVQGDLAWAGINLGLLLMDLCLFWYLRRRSIREYILRHKGIAIKTKQKKRRM